MVIGDNLHGWLHIYVYQTFPILHNALNEYELFLFQYYSCILYIKDQQGNQIDIILKTTIRIYTNRKYIWLCDLNIQITDLYKIKSLVHFQQGKLIGSVSFYHKTPVRIFNQSYVDFVHIRLYRQPQNLMILVYYFLWHIISFHYSHNIKILQQCLSRSILIKIIHLKS